MRVSVIMSVCAWPNPADILGAPHHYLTRALDSIIAARHPAGESHDVPPSEWPAVEILVGIDGQRPEVHNAIFKWAVGYTTSTPDGFAEWHDGDARKAVGGLVPLFQDWETCGTIAGSDIAPREWDGVRVRTYSCPFRGQWGNPQRNSLLPEAHGDLVYLTDQDDAMIPDSLRQACLIASANPGAPIVGKMRIWCYGVHTQPLDPPDVLWKTRGRVEEGHFGGHMLIVPNEQAKLGRFVPEDLYSADFRYVQATLTAFAAAGREAVWVDQFFAETRPWTRKVVTP